MKNTLKKLLIAAGICAASTSAFATNTFFVNIINNTGKVVSVNYEEGRYAWDGSHGSVQNVHEMTNETNHVINPWGTDLGVTGDNYTWGHDDEMFFSITEQDPNSPRKGKKVKAATKFVSIGTVLHIDCLISKLSRNRDYHTIINRAVLLEDGQTIDDIFESDLWLECKKIYFDDKIEDPQIQARKFYEKHIDS